MKCLGELSLSHPGAFSQCFDARYATHLRQLLFGQRLSVWVRQGGFAHLRI